MTNRNFYLVTFQTADGMRQSSQTFSTLRAARNRAKWMMAQAWASNVLVMRGGIGGEVVS